MHWRYSKVIKRKNYINPFTVCQIISYKEVFFLCCKQHLFFITNTLYQSMLINHHFVIVIYNYKTIATVNEIHLHVIFWLIATSCNYNQWLSLTRNHNSIFIRRKRRREDWILQRWFTGFLTHFHLVSGAMIFGSTQLVHVAYI